MGAISLLDPTASQPRLASLRSTAWTAGWVRRAATASRPIARTSTKASTALTAVAETAMAMPSTLPNNMPALMVNAVLGNGETVTTACTRKNNNGNIGPTDLAQSRIWVGPGCGTNTAIATRASAPSSATINRGSLSRVRTCKGYRRYRAGAPDWRRTPG